VAAARGALEALFYTIVTGAACLIIHILIRNMQPSKTPFYYTLGDDENLETTYMYMFV
jgi:hypothetical protein